MIRKILLASVAAAALSTTAFAADLPSRRAPAAYVPAAPIFTWTGFYVGGQIGYAWGTNKAPFYILPNTNTGFDFGNKPDGILGGLHAGYNMQSGSIVYGLEGDIELSRVRATTSLGGARFARFSDDVRGSVRGRVGYAFDRALLYVTGGVAIADLKSRVCNGAVCDTANPTRAGWTVGAGAEYAITNNWTARAEYRYSDFGKFNNVLTNTTGNVFGLHHRYNDHAVRVGVSYKFGGYDAPVVAKY